MPTNAVHPLTLATFNTAGMLATYQAINPNGFAQPIFFLRIVNDSGNAITISYDGTNDHEYIPANGHLEIFSQINSGPANQVILFSARTVIYVKGTAGAGTVAVSGYYS